MDNPDELKDLYATTDSRLDTLLDRSHVKFWRALRNAMDKQPAMDAIAIADYVDEHFGVRLQTTQNGQAFIPEAHIIDEQKYLVFLLRFGG